MIHINTPSEEAWEKTNKLLDGLGNTRRWEGMTSGSNIVILTERTIHRNFRKVMKLLGKWLPDLKITVESRTYSDDNLHIFLPFKAGDTIPSLPGREDKYSRDSEGFLTNPDNWSKGLNLV
jgi:hypothetical protein